MRLILLLVLIFPFITYGNQITKIDSLKNILPTLQEDSLKLKTLRKIKLYYVSEKHPNLDSVNYYSSQCEKLIYKLNVKHYLPSIYYDKAYAYKSNNQLDTAEYWARKGYQLAEDLKLDYDKTAAGYILAMILVEKNNIKEAISQILQNIKFARIHNFNHYIFANYHQLATLNYTDGNTDPFSSYFMDKAFSYSNDETLTKAAKIRKDIILKIKSGLPVDQDIQSFIQFLEKQKEIYLNFKYQYLLEIGNAFLYTKQPEKALQIFLPLGKIKNSDTTDSEFHTYYRITDAYLQLNQLDNAKKWHQKARVGEKAVNLFYNYHYFLKNDALIKEKEGKYADALRVMKEAQHWKDSLDEKRNQLNFLQVTTFESMENLENEVSLIKSLNESQQAHIEKDNRIKHLLGIIVILLIAGLILISVFLKRAKKRSELIQKQKADIEIQAQKLNESNQIKDKLFSMISHELRSPVAELISILNVRFQNFDPNAYQTYFTNILNKAQSIYSTMDGLLTWSASQIQLKPNHLFPLNLKNILQSVLQLVNSKIHQKNITIINQAQDTLILGNENQTTVILRNIINNAIKFTPENGYIRIYSIEEDNLKGYAIKDTGIGIKKEKLATLFKDVQISQTGTAGEKGNGVGLIICKDLIEKQHGKIEINSEENAGTEVRILFPKA